MFNNVTGSSFDLDKARQEQLELELKSDSELIAKSVQEALDNAAEGDLNLPKARRVIAAAFESVRDYIVEIQGRPMRGRSAKYLQWLRNLDPEVAAVIAIRSTIERCITREAPTFQSITTAIGRQYVTEVRIAEAAKVNPLYMAEVHHNLDRVNVSSVRHRKAAFDVAYRKVMEGNRNTNLTDVELVQLGKFGLEACYETGLVELEVTGVGPKSQHLYRLSPDVQSYILDYSEKDFRHLLSTADQIMICPPDTWSTGMGGGYLSERRKWNTKVLTGTYPKGFIKEFTEDNYGKMFRVFNYLQSVPYELHSPTLELLKSVWLKGGGLFGVPSTTFPDKPPFPFAETWDKSTATPQELEVFNLWRSRTASWHYAERTWRSKLLETSSLIKGMGDLDNRPIWFPVFADSRGRLYYRGSPNPQGSQIAKATIHFHEKKPLGERGIYWLKVHIANCYGLDDVRFDLRVKWVEDNWEALERAVGAPVDHEDVWGTDAPLMMFAAVYELHRAYQSGSPTEYACGIPIPMDATCSGIQHFSALLRDPVGAKHVNLVDTAGDKKQDIYRAVGKSAELHLQNLAEAGHVGALPWTRLGVSRDLAKRPVMTKVYGVTLLTVIRYVTEKAKEAYPVEEFKADNFTALAKALLEGVGIALPAVVQGMSWLQSVARQSTNPTGLTWTVPSGFKVHHSYMKYNDTRVKVNSSGVVQVVLRTTLDEVNVRKSTNAISPNFIHSLDGAHVALTADTMRAKGLAFLSVHDSFASHAADVDTLHEVIRQEFVNLYTHDVAGQFLKDTGSKVEPPTQGIFDLEEVKNSEFFFS